MWMWVVCDLNLYIDTQIRNDNYSSVCRILKVVSLSIWFNFCFRLSLSSLSPPSWLNYLQDETLWSVGDVNRMVVRDPPQRWLGILSTVLLVSLWHMLRTANWFRYFQCHRVQICCRNRRMCRHMFNLLIAMSVTSFYGMLVSTSPIRKWLDVKALRSFPSFWSDDTGMIGREFRMVSILMVFIVSNLNNWFSTIITSCFYIVLTAASRVLEWNATLPASVLDNREC